VKQQKIPLIPLIPLAAILLAAPAAAQQDGATPGTGIRHAPSVAINPATRPATASSELSQAPSTPGTLSAAEAAALAAAFKAVDDGRYADARAAVANFNNSLLVRIVDWTVLRAAPRTDADFAATWRFLRENPDWPEPEVLRRQAEDRITPGTPAREVWRYFTAFPPLTSSGHMRRLEAAGLASALDVPRFASDSWRVGTFRRTDEEEFLNKYGRYLSGEDQIARFDRILKEGRAPAARDLLSKLPPDYQSLANARLAMAERAADAANLLREVPAAKLADPAIKLEQLTWLRRSGKLNEAMALALQPPPTQTEAWWNERQLLARDMLAAGHAADAYAVTVPHGQAKGVAFAEAEFLAGWIALRHLKKPAEGLKHFQTLYEGVSTDVPKSRAAYWLGRAHETAGRSREALEWFARAATYGQTFYGQLAARRLPGSATRLPEEPAVTPAEQQSLTSRELVVVAR